MATITLGGNVYTLITLPAAPGFSEISLSMLNQVAVVESPYVPSQQQTQTWPGADRWGLQATLPKMTQLTAGAWRAFLAGLRGKENVFQVGDPAMRAINGGAGSNDAPVVNGALSGNPIAATILDTKGWRPSIYRLLLPGDYMQVGFRLHMVAAEVDSDVNGHASISVWPSLRDSPADSTPIVLKNTVGVFRLAANMSNWHTSNDHLTQLSFQAVEAR